MYLALFRRRSIVTINAYDNHSLYGTQKIWMLKRWSNAEMEWLKAIPPATLVEERDRGALQSSLLKVLALFQR